MPRAVDNARKALISCTRKMVAKEGYSAFSMRNVAKECGMAPGTIYNYFHSKDDLIGACMLEDWETASKNMHKTIEKKTGCMDVLETVYTTIRKFCDANSSVIQDSRACANFRAHSKEYHVVILETVSGAISSACEKYAVSFTPELVPFIAEDIIKYSVRGVDFKTFSAIIAPLFNTKKKN